MMNIQETLDDQLLEAAWSGHTDTVIALLERGATIEAQAKDGWTALMCAAKRGRTTTVFALLERGANVAVKNNVGLTAGDYARKADHNRVIDLLNNWADKQALSTLIKAKPEYQESGFNF